MNIAVNIGFADADRAGVVQGLSKLLADTYLLYLKTHGYHWNVTGATFRARTSCSKSNIASSGKHWTRSPSAFARWASSRRRAIRPSPT